MYDELHAEKVAYKAAQAACSAAPATFDDTPADSDCLAKAESDFAAASKATKAKIPAVAIKTVTSVIALKSCFSPL